MGAVRYDYTALQKNALTVLNTTEPTLGQLAQQLGVKPHIANKVIQKLRRLAGAHGAAIVTIKDGYQGHTRYRLTAQPREVSAWRLTQTRGINSRLITIREQLAIEIAGTNGRTNYGKSIRRAQRMLNSVEAEIEAGVEELQEELA